MRDYEGFCGDCDKETRLFSYRNKFLCKDCFSLTEVPDDTEQKSDDKKDYSRLLRESVRDCIEYEGILKYLPDFYVILCNMASDNKTDWYTKMLVNSALAYLVIERDIIPEKGNPKGYLDDLFICVYVLKEIRDKISTEIITNNLKKSNLSKEEILDTIYYVFSKSSEYLERKIDKILSLVGLSRFNLFDFMYLDDKNVQLTKYKKKRKLIYAMLAVKVRQVFTNIHGGSRMEHLKSHLKEHPEYIEIKRLMEFD